VELNRSHRGAPLAGRLRDRPSVPSPRGPLSVRARLYVAAVITSGLGLLVVVAALHGSSLVRHGSVGMWVLLGAVIVGELAPIKLGTGEGEVAPSTTFTFALLLSSGLAAAAIAVAAASALSDVIDRKRPSRSAFNVAQYVLAIAAAGGVLVAAGVLPHHQDFSAADVPAILAAALVFFVVNTGLVAGAGLLVLTRALPQADFAAWLTARELSELALSA
jgi:hypothetical protein